MARTTSQNRQQNRAESMQNRPGGFDPNAAAAAAQKAAEDVASGRSASGSKKDGSYQRQEKNYYNEKFDEPTIKRVEELAPYTEFAHENLESIPDIIKRYREKGSYRDKSILVAIAYGGHCVMHLAGSDLRYVVDIVRKGKEVALEARLLNYDESRKSYLPLGQTTYARTVDYLVARLQKAKRDPERYKDAEKKSEIVKLNEQNEAKAAAAKKTKQDLEKNPPKDIRDEVSAWKALIGDLCTALGYDAAKTAAYQGLRDSYKMVIADVLTSWIGTDCGKNGYKPLQEYIDEYLKNGYIEGAFNKDMLSSDVKARIEAGLMTKDEAIVRARKDLSMTAAYMIRSSVDGKPMKTYVNRAYRMLDKQEDKNSVRVNKNDYTITDAQLKSMAYGMLVTLYSKQGNPLTIMYDGFSSSIKEESRCGQCIKAAYAIEHGQHISAAQEEAQEQEEKNDMSFDSGEGMSPDEDMAPGIDG